MDVIGRHLVEFLAKSESEFYHDAILISQQGKRIGVHKVVLAAHSQHFNKMFMSPLQGNNNNNQTKVSVYHLPGTSSAMLETILNWMYSGHIAVTGDNVLELMEQAEYFSIQGLKLKCEDWINDNIDSDNVVTVLDMATFLHLSRLIAQCELFLLSGLNHENALEMWRMGEEHGMAKLKKKAWGWIKQHLVLNTIDEKKGLLEVGMGQLMDLISNDCVACREEVVWDVVVRWASQPMKSRRELSKAVSAVRMDLIDPHFFQSEIRKSVLYKVAQSDGQNEDNKIYQSALDKIGSELADVETTSGWPGGFLFEFSNRVESDEVMVNAYNPRANTWTSLGVGLPGQWESMKVAVMGSSIYLGGGVRKLGTLVEYRAFYRFDPNLLSFTRLADLLEGDMCLVAVEDQIISLSYIWNYNKHTMAVYNVANNTWGRGPTSMTGGAGAGAAMLGGDLYKVGHEVELWDPDTHKWTDVPIDTQLAALQLQNEGDPIYCAALEGLLYVLAGGGAGWSFCPRTTTWTELPRVDNAQGWCMAVAMEGSLYGGVVGHNGETGLARLGGDRWELVNCGGRSLSSCGVVNTRGLSRETRKCLVEGEE